MARGDARRRFEPPLGPLRELDLPARLVDPLRFGCRPGSGHATNHLHEGRPLRPRDGAVVGHSAYIRGTAFTLRNYFALSPAQASRYAGAWISVPDTAKSYTPVAADATLGSFLGHLLPRKHLSVVRATIAGRKAVGVRGALREAGLQVVETVYAPAAGEPLRFEEQATPVGRPGTSLARMSRWNEPVHVTAPAHAVPISAVLAH